MRYLTSGILGALILGVFAYFLPTYFGVGVVIAIAIFLEVKWKLISKTITKKNIGNLLLIVAIVEMVFLVLPVFSGFALHMQTALLALVVAVGVAMALRGDFKGDAAKYLGFTALVLGGFLIVKAFVSFQYATTPSFRLFIDTYLGGSPVTIEMMMWAILVFAVASMEEVKEKAGAVPGYVILNGIICAMWPSWYMDLHKTPIPWIGHALIALLAGPLSKTSMAFNIRLSRKLQVAAAVLLLCVIGWRGTVFSGERAVAKDPEGAGYVARKIAGADACTKANAEPGGPLIKFPEKIEFNPSLVKVTEKTQPRPRQDKAAAESHVVVSPSVPGWTQGARILTVPGEYQIKAGEGVCFEVGTWKPGELIQVLVTEGAPVSYSTWKPAYATKDGGGTAEASGFHLKMKGPAPFSYFVQFDKDCQIAVGVVSE